MGIWDYTHASQTRLCVCWMLAGCCCDRSPQRQGAAVATCERRAVDLQRSRSRKIGEAPSTSVDKPANHSLVQTCACLAVVPEVEPQCDPCGLLEEFYNHDWSLASGERLACGEEAGGVAHPRVGQGGEERGFKAARPLSYLRAIRRERSETPLTLQTWPSAGALW